MYDVIANAVGTDGAVQITGGEPTCRKDLPEIIRMGREKGFWGIEVNTNGLVIAARDGYLEELVWAGLTGVYLSFDGLTGEVYEGTCGRDILDVKMRVIERCREVGIQVVLSVAVVAGLNDGQLGDLLRFCLDNADVVAGLALQPAFTSGRFDAERALPMSSGDVIFQLAEQSDGLLEPRDVWPLGCSNPLCDTGVFFVKGEPPAGVPAHPSGILPGHARHDDGGVPRGVLARQSAGLGVPGHPGQEGRRGGERALRGHHELHGRGVHGHAAPARVLHDGDGARRARHSVLLVPSDRFRRAARVPAVVQGGAALTLPLPSVLSVM